ncbi:MAG: STAS domain-containing protein [Candidatus Latescibacterota bacterium]|nr:MAG: STAS domain-containing protein [Candidatus Latescibacterota bacterium]
MKVKSGGDQELRKVLRGALHGQLDAQGADVVWEGLQAQLNREYPSLLLDMGGVGFVSSAGISTLVRLLSTTQSLNGAMTVFGCNERVRSVLKILMLEKVLNVCDSEADARSRLRELGAS